jgi:uroporphyrinogen-III decarboxylase
VPFNFWMDRDQMAKYDEEWGHDFRITHYGVDVVEAFIGLHWWPGVQAEYINDGKTSWQVKPLVNSLEEAMDLPMPDPTADGVYADLTGKREAYPDKAIFGMLIAPLDTLHTLRLADIYTDLVDYPELIHELLAKIRPVQIEAAKRACATDIDVLYLAGDICGSNGPMISPRQLREFLFDYLKEVIEIAHAAGKKVFYHSDGLVLDLLSVYMDYGIDGCNPVEPRYNDAREFVNRTDGKLMLYGGLDNCGIIPEGSVDEVRKHVRSQFETLGSQGKLIFSTHDIPSQCPRENLDAMVEEIKACTY